MGAADTWTPRSLKATQLRPDLAERLATFSYDGASRLTTTARTAGPAADAVPQAWSFGYDTAQNLLAREERTAWGDDLTSLPVDASGRNRPAAVDGVALEYDLAGNLTRKGDRTFHYDAFNRLVRVAGPGGTIATYRYDAFNRRVEAVVGSTTRTTTWAGWQALETRTDGVLGERRTFGLGLDEVVLVERDTDGDGVPDQRYRPLFDSIGNVALLLDEAGQVLERYDYSPFGQRWVLVNDLTPPQVEQLRIDAGALVVELSEEVSRADLEAAETAGLLVLEETATGTPVPFTWSLPVTEGRAARRRLVLTPDITPAAGAELRVSLGVGALADLFGNATTSTHDQTFPWQAGVVADTASPELLVVALSQSHLQVTFSEPVDPGTATAALLVDGATTVWTTSADGYILETTSALSAGSHTLRIETTLTDLAGQPLSTAFETTFEVTAGTPDRLVHLTPDPHLLTSSTVGNLHGFHGRPVDPETGLMYFRNRYYDPEMGRFVSTDPLGYVDGPNLYQYSLNSPINLSDPTGLCPTCIQQVREHEASAETARYLERRRNFLTQPPSMVAVQGSAARGLGYYLVDQWTVGFFSAPEARYRPLNDATQATADLARFREDYGKAAKVGELIAALRNPAKGWRMVETGVAALDLLDEVGGKVRVPVEMEDGTVRMVEYEPAGAGSKWRDETGRFVTAPEVFQEVNPDALPTATVDVTDEFERLKRAEAFREDVERAQQAESGLDAFIEFGRAVYKKLVKRR